MRDSAFAHLKRHLLPAVALPVLTQARFLAALETSRRQLPGLVPSLVTHVGNCLRLATQIRARQPAAATAPGKKPTAARIGVRLSDLSQLALPAPTVPRPGNSAGGSLEWISGELEMLMPRRFLDQLPFSQLPHWNRYLKALLTRIERASNNPLKDQERAALVAPHLAAWREFQASPPKSESARAALQEYRWLLEEYKVSVYAQELGTAQPSSPPRLAQALARVREQ